MPGTETAFDQYALSYDADFTRSSTGTFQRRRVWSYLERNLPAWKNPSVLELNCGTGEDALWFCKKGFEVSASDLSGEMVGVAKEKLDGKNAVVFQSDMREVAAKMKGKTFDLIFSDFGGMNCLGPGELQSSAKDFSELLKPGGRLILVIMGRNCKWEQWYFKRKKDRASAFRRQSKEPVEAVIFGEHFSTWYYSPEEIKNLFAEHFTVKTNKPVGIALPPSYLDAYFRKKTGLLKTLNVFEKIIGNLSSLSDRADHFIIDFVKK